MACPTKRVSSKSGSGVMDSSSRVSQFLAKSLSYNPIKLIEVFPYNSHFAISAPLNSLCVWGERGGGEAEGASIRLLNKKYYSALKYYSLQLNRYSRSVKLSKKASLSLLLGRMCSTSSAPCLKIGTKQVRSRRHLIGRISM